MTMQTVVMALLACTVTTNSVDIPWSASESDTHNDNDHDAPGSMCVIQDFSPHEQYKRGIVSLQSDPLKGVEWLEAAARGGHPQAAFALGDHFETSQPRRATAFYLLAMERGDADAAYNVALLYMRGAHAENAKPNLPRALEAFKVAADLGKEADTEYLVGTWLGQGQGTPDGPDHTAASEYIRRAADQGHGDAAYSYAVMHMRGLGVEKNDDRAVEYLTIAANTGHPSATAILGKMASRQSVDSKKTDTAKTMKFDEEHWSAQYPGGWTQSPIFQSCIVPAVDNDDVQCNFNLGLLFATGTAQANPNAKTAAQFYRTAAKAGNAKAAFNLALLYEQEGVTVFGFDAPSQALHWFRVAASSGLHGAQVALGTMYERGYGMGRPNATAALEWYTVAAEGGQVGAQYKVGTMHAQGVGCVRDHSVAEEWFRQAAIHNHTEARLVLAVAAEKAGRDTDAISWLAPAAESGDATAMHRLGELLARPSATPRATSAPERNGKRMHDFSTATYWLQKAAEAGVTGAMMSLADFLTRGVGGAKDTDAASTWVRRAAEAGHKGAFFPHGFAMEQNVRRQGSRRQGDSAEATSWIRKAAQFGEPRAMYNLALKSKEAQQNTTASGWFTRAALQRWLPAVPRAALSRSSAPSALLMAMLAHTARSDKAGLSLQHKAAAALDTLATTVQDQNQDHHHRVNVNYVNVSDTTRAAAVSTGLYTLHDPEAMRTAGLCVPGHGDDAGCPQAVVVAVHGRHGDHATSWEASVGAGRAPVSLLSDLVAGDPALPTVRVLSFSYNASDWTDGEGLLDTTGLRDALCSHLVEADAVAASRPMLVVAHGEGAAIVASALPCLIGVTGATVVLDPEVHERQGSDAESMLPCVAAVVSAQHTCESVLPAMACPCIASTASSDSLPRPTHRDSETYLTLAAAVGELVGTQQ
eukprot:m.116551 g.116551  ORF g.116551 m.116551 type:complete len:928 (-) comp10922_c2_seq2:157-2940(-)